MREYKFRGKRVDNGEWVFGFYVYMGVSRRGTSHLEFAHMILDSSSKDAEGLVQYEVIPETVGQYTGLRDRNGVEIFEGDVVRFVGRSCLVNFVQNDCAFRIEVDNKGSIALRKARSNDLQVIGTIHDKE